VKLRIPLFGDHPSLRVPAHVARRVLVLLAPTEADVRAVRSLARALRPVGVAVQAASECHGEVRGERDEALWPNRILVDAAPEQFDAVVVAGGRGAARVVEDIFAREWITHAAQLGKPVAALGAGRRVLERAGLAHGTFADDDPHRIAAWLEDRLRLPAPRHPIASTRTRLSPGIIV